MVINNNFNIGETVYYKGVIDNILVAKVYRVIVAPNSTIYYEIKVMNGFVLEIKEESLRRNRNEF